MTTNIHNNWLVRETARFQNQLIHFIQFSFSDMNAIFAIDAVELRQIIREELSHVNPNREAARPTEVPLTTIELCKYLNITESTLIRWRKKGKVPFLQLGGNIRYMKRDVLAALEKNQKGGKKCL